MAEHRSTGTTGRTGDWVEIHGPSGKRSRCGQITEVLGAAGREHYRVRWEGEQESIFYPAAGVVIVRRTGRPAQRKGRAGSGRSGSASARSRPASARSR